MEYSGKTGIFFLLVLQQIENITELNVVLRYNWGGEVTEIRNAASLGYNIGFALLFNDCKYLEKNRQMLSNVFYLLSFLELLAND